MPTHDPRLSFQEAMELADLPLPPDAAAHSIVRRCMSRRPAWLPGSDIPRLADLCGPDKAMPVVPPSSYGSHVYAQAALAVAGAVDAEELARGWKPGQRRLGLHTVHGQFCLYSLSDRPLFYEVVVVSNDQFSFRTYLVTARQPTDSSSSPPPPGWDGGSGEGGGDSSPSYRFPLSDATREPWSDLGPMCFSAMVTFKLPEPHADGVSTQMPPPHARFAEVLSSRPPGDWPATPRLDIAGILDGLEARGDGRARDPGSFPAVDMKKVDMRAYNAGRPMHERRELVLYRILRPLPDAESVNGNAHALVHAFEADRNGVLMAGNFLGFGRGLGMATSLSYSFVVHTNVDEARMRHESETADGRAEWWIQEATFPRVANGRVMMESRIWSPRGVHVATEYQDGILRVRPGLEDRSGRERL